jgi:hypothetical protein
MKNIKYYFKKYRFQILLGLIAIAMIYFIIKILNSIETETNNWFKQSIFKLTKGDIIIYICFIGLFFNLFKKDGKKS